MVHPELDFFNTISGQLEIELTEPTQNIGTLLNQRATPEARIKSLRLVPEIFVEDSGSFRELTSEELHSVAFNGSEITLVNDAEQPVTHKAPNGKSFSVSDLLKAVEETERQTRGNTEWFGGIDVNHVYFEGIDFDDGVGMICWGS